jgi:hypothetical protein
LNTLHEKFLKLYLRTALTNINEVQGVIERRKRSENIVYAHYSTRNPRSRKVAVSIQECAMRIFHSMKTSGRTVTHASTQHIKEMSTRNIFRGKSGRCAGLTTLPSSCAECQEVWECQSTETLRTCQARTEIVLPLLDSKSLIPSTWPNVILLVLFRV